MIDQCYSEVERTVKGLAWHYSRRTGMDYEELVSIGNEAFMRAHASYDFANSRCFGAWVRLVVNSALMDAVRDSMLRASRAGVPLEDVADPMGREHRQDPWDLLEDLPIKAARVLEAALAPPPDVVIDALEESRQGLDVPGIMRKCIRRYFAALGWTAEEIDEAFQQVAEAL